MNPLTIGMLIFAFTFGGALAGVWLHTRLPEQHRGGDTRSTVNVGIGLIATMTALVLGLVTASAKNSFDSLDSAVKHSAVEILTLDRTLARYGSASDSARAALRAAVLAGRNKVWPGAESDAPERPTAGAPGGPESVVQLIRALPAQDDDQRWLKSRALDLGERLLEARWAMFSSIGTAIPVPFLVVLAFWLTMIFTSFGLFAPRNVTAISILLVCALSVASAIFLILEMDGPFSGVIQISPEPLDFALAHMSR